MRSGDSKQKEIERRKGETVMLTPDQTRHVKNALEAAIMMDIAMDELDNAIRTQAAPNKDLTMMVRLVSRSQRDTNMIPLLLMGYREEITLEARINLAWERLKRAVEDTIPTAAKAAETIILASNALNAAHERFTDLFTSPKENFFHSDPPYELPNTGPIRTVIAAHGDYYKFIHHMHQALHYWNDWADTFWRIYAGSTDKYDHFGDALKLHSYCCTLVFKAAALASGISLYYKWDGLDQFCKVLKATELLWDAAEGESAAQIYHTFMISWAKALGLTNYKLESLIRFTDSWRNADGGGYKGLMRFPNSTRCL